MGITVHTLATCDRCGVQQTQEGADIGFPPVGWAEQTVRTKGDGPVWLMLQEGPTYLCPECRVELEEFLSGP